jgi:sec-independent protein translocase protein TatC
MKQDKTQDKSMSFLGHIDELRGHLLRSAVAIVFGSIIVGLNKSILFDHILFGPTKKDFITFKLFNKIGNFIGIGDVFQNTKDIPIQNLQLMGQFNLYILACVVGGIVLVFPYIVWEIWRFISPALNEKEKKNSVVFILSTYILFMIGIFFGYFFVAPLAINFGYFFTVSDLIQNNYTVTNYSSILIQSVVAMGIVFLFPIVVYFLTRLEIITPQFLKTYRKHAFVIILIIAAIITPSDLLSMFSAAIPLWFLYEFSILVSVIVNKQNNSSKNTSQIS